MAITFKTIQSLLILFAPVLLPRAFSLYRSIRSPPPGRNAPAICPPPPGVSRALLLLFVVAVAFIVKTFPIFAPENVFVMTQSRVLAPVDVIFRRLATLRPTGALLPRDETLRAQLTNMDARLLYFQYGPDVITDCPFCTAEDPKSFFYYAVPGLILPHVWNLLVLATVQSPLVSGRDGTRWRQLATVAAVAVCLIDLYVVNSYNPVANARANRLMDLDNFFWTMRVYRYTALSGLNGLVGWVMWLASTNRAFVKPPPPSERIDAATKALAVAKSKLNAVGIVKNTALRDGILRNRNTAYWAHEVRLMSEVMEERDVIESVNNALEQRLNISAISRDAETYTQAVLGSTTGDKVA